MSSRSSMCLLFVAVLAGGCGADGDEDRPAGDGSPPAADGVMASADGATDAGGSMTDAATPGADARTPAVDAAPGADATVSADATTGGYAAVVTDAAPARDGAAPLDAEPRPRPDAAPVACEPACEGGEVCVAGQCARRITGVMEIDGVLFGDEARYNTEILRAQNPDMSWRPSRVYKWRDFVQAVATMYSPGVGEMRLWLGDADAEAQLRARYALVNLAAFLAQSMKETIKYDACDENNWDDTNNYQISNACGQLGQVYANYDCEMACPRDPTMVQSAVTNAAWYGAPGPFFCAPDATLRAANLLTAEGRTGRWNHNHDCWPYPATEEDFTPAEGPAYSRPECEIYVGQKGGRWEWDGSGGSVEGCCWWGRGVIQTTGRCNFGVLNHFLGQSHLDPAAHAPPANVLYPNVDFCRDPSVICASADHPELKWIAGLFYWMSSVQSYDVDGWQYLTALRAFVDGGLQGDAFIDAVSGIVNRGCHNPPCATGAVDGVNDRRANFDAVLRVMGLR